MSKCPRCTILVNFPDDHNGRWYKCPECYSYIRELSLKTSGITRVDLGKSTPTGIVLVPASTVIVKPAARIPTIPRNVIPIPQPTQQNQAKAGSSALAKNTSRGGGTSNSMQTVNVERNSLSLEQIRTRRKQVMDEITSLEEQNRVLFSELMQEYKNDPTWIPIIVENLQAAKENRLKLIGRLQKLNSLEVESLDKKNQELNSKLEFRSAVNTKSDKKPIHFGYSAFVGIGAMIWFTLSIGIQQWEFKTVLMMLGVGVGIALVGWLMGGGANN
jgi:hypothetical protein